MRNKERIRSLKTGFEKRHKHWRKRKRSGARTESKADFYAKMYISYKEANETEYWLELLYESGYIEKTAFDSIYSDCKEIIKILTSITKTMKTNYEK